MADNFVQFAEGIFDANLRFHPLYILPFIIIAYILYKYHHKDIEERPGFLSWLFPSAIYFHPSHIVDIKIFLLSRVLAIGDFLSAFFAQIFMALFTMNLIEILTESTPPETPLTTGNMILITLTMTIIADFCVYWIHRIHHEKPILWPFHSVHHSAEVLSPITAYRKHPFYDFVSNLVKSVFIGITQGVFLSLLFDEIDLFMLAGANFIYVAFNFTGSNFRHSHIWLRYGRTLEHIFISPAQHQVHHSLEPKHHNKNFGEILAIWDWMFGTLYIPEGKEELSFGISKSSSSNVRIKQPHNNLKEALIVPFTDSWKIFQKSRKKRPQQKETPDS